MTLPEFDDDETTPSGNHPALVHHDTSPTPVPAFEIDRQTPTEPQSPTARKRRISEQTLLMLSRERLEQLVELGETPEIVEAAKRALAILDDAGTES